MLHADPVLSITGFVAMWAMKVEDYRNSMKVITKTLVAAIAVVAVGYWGSRLLHAQIRSASRIPPLTIAFESLSSGGVSRELWEASRR